MSILYLIPVPIAENALHTLSPEVPSVVRRLDFFIAERAKTARQFLKSVGIERPLQQIEVVEIDARERASALSACQEAFRAGRDVGLVSEAGCPGVADPGAEFVALAHRCGVAVKPLVGPSSILLALMASGMNGQQFAFHGYLPAKRPELAAALRRLEQACGKQGQTQLFIETPYRSHMVLEVALESLRPDTVFGIAEDITGAQESIRVMRISEWKQKGAPETGKNPAVFMIGTSF